MNDDIRERRKTKMKELEEGPKDYEVTVSLTYATLCEVRRISGECGITESELLEQEAICSILDYCEFEETIWKDGDPQ